MYYSSSLGNASVVVQITSQGITSDKISTKECSEIIPKQIFLFSHIYILYTNLQLLHKWHHAPNSIATFYFQ